MKKIPKILYILIFLLISLAPMGLYIFNYYAGIESTDNIEKREAVVFPTIYSDAGINDSFDDECEEWLNQNIPYRGQVLTQINVGLSDILKEPTSNVITGRDGWIFSNETIDNYMDVNSLSEVDIQSIGITLSLIQERIEERGGHFLFVAVPNKNSIYPENMPLRYVKATENNLDRLLTVLTDDGVKYIDLKSALTNAKADSNGRLYYKRDTHWTVLGALVGYESMMEELGRSPLEYDRDTLLADYSRVSDLDKLLYPYGKRYDEEYSIDNHLDYESFEFIYPSGVADTKAQLDNFMSDKEDHDTNFSTKQRSPKDNSSLYMIRDSFGRALLPFMIDTYAEATFVRSVTPSFENNTDCEDVIYEICERNLRNLIASAPYVLAPQRDEVAVSELCESELNTCYISDEGYALRIYGTIMPEMLGDDGRIYVELSQDSKELLYEAFPIYEETLMAEVLSDKGRKASKWDKSHTVGYSLYIDKKDFETGDYDISVLSGKGKSAALAEWSVDNNADDSVEETANVAVNPYGDENVKHQIEYRGVTIGIGDNINTLKSGLGDQAAPSQIITSCLSGEDAVMYYYPNITLETDMEGNIYYISLMDNSYSDGKANAVTASGITIGSDKKDIWAKVGEPAKENDKNCIFKTEHLVITYSYKHEQVTSVILEDSKYSSFDETDDEDSIPGVEYSCGNTYLYDDTHQIQTGWKIIDGEYYFFDRLTGERIVGQTVDGIEIGIDGEVSLSEYEKDKIATMMKANQIMVQVTTPSDTMEEKRRKVFDWVMSFPYHQFRNFKEVYRDEGIEIIEANDIFEEGAGDCVSESAALAFLFHEIGYNNVYWVHDTGHSWVRSDDKLFDPLFAEARDFNANYDAEFKDYRKMMDYSMLIY